MSSAIKHQERMRDRARALGEARKLARSGQYEDHVGIVATLQVEGLVGAASKWFADPFFTLQLDRLCAMARERATRQPLKIVRERGRPAAA
ncbi:hypothetical protein [Methylobacterium sp. JK268]